ALRWAMAFRIRACMMNRICIWIMVGGLTVLWLPPGAAASNCQVETSAPGPGAILMRHLGADCTEQEREARAVDATQLLQAFKEGKGIDLSGVVIRGDLSLDTLPIGPLPPEVKGMKELQEHEVRVISGSMAIVNSVVHGAIRHGSAQGLLVVQGPVTFSGTRFEQLVDLSRAVFIQPVTLSGTVFLRESYFVQGRFLRGLYAEKTAFGLHARFHRSVFQGPVTFQQAGFHGLSEFLEVVFEKDVNLSRTFFKLGTGFSGSRFQGLADFSDASFDREAFFTFTLFDGDADFRRVTFRSTADFSNASFKGRDDFSTAVFEKGSPFTRAARPASGQTPLGLENQTVQYAIAFSILAFGALLIVYLIRSR
ncbi:MAG: pentapeptide repeat-containing protein, partial [Nitrospirota bacterium]